MAGAWCPWLRKLHAAVFGTFLWLTRSDLGQAAIHRFLREANDDAKPSVWTADPDRIIGRGHQALDSIH